MLSTAEVQSRKVASQTMGTWKACGVVLLCPRARTPRAGSQEGNSRSALNSSSGVQLSEIVHRPVHEKNSILHPRCVAGGLEEHHCEAGRDEPT